jgi:signal peptidase I
VAFVGVLILYLAALVDVLSLRVASVVVPARVVVVYTLCFVVAMLVFRVAVRRALVEAYRIPAGSMIPTLHIGDHLFINKTAYWFSEPERGDVVVFAYPCRPRNDFIKRIVAVGGDTVELRCNIVYVNGEPAPQELVADRDECVWWDFDPMGGHAWEKSMCSRYTEVLGDHRYDVIYAPERPAADRRRNRVDQPIEYAHVPADRDFPDLRSGVPGLPGCEPDHDELDPSARGHFVESRPGPGAAQSGVCAPTLAYQVAPGHVFVLGDNRDDSSDSRIWGPVPVDDIKGKATMIWWSTGPAGVAWDRIGQAIE